MAASITVRGNVTEALAALEALGIKAETTAEKTEAAFGDKLAGSTERAGGLFSKLGNIVGGLGLPFGESFGKMGESVEKAETEGKSFGGTMSELGKVLTVGLVGGAVAAGAEGVNLATKYQSATASLAASAGITQKAAGKIGDAFLSTAGQSTFSAQEIMSAFAPVAGQLGTVEGHALSSGESLQTMKAAMDLAEASGGNLTATTGSLASIMQAFHLSTGQAAGAADVLFETSNKTGNSVEAVAQATAKMHMKLGDATPSLQQVGGLMVTLAQNGVSGSRGMSMASAGLTTLLGGSKATAAELKTLGVHLYDSQGQFVGLGSVLAQLGPQFANMSEQQYNAATKTLFGASAAQTFGQMAQYGSQQLDANTAAVTRSGAAQEAAEKQAATFHGSMEKLKATGEDLAVKFGELLIPVIQRLMTIIAGVVTWFMKHKAAAEAVGIAIGVLVAGPIAAYIVSMAAAAAASIAAAAPILAIVAVVAAVGVAIYELVKHWSEVWGEIKSVTSGAWSAIRGFFSEGIDWVESHWKLLASVLLIVVTGGLGAIPVLISKYWSQITGFTSKLWSDVTGWFGKMWADVVYIVAGGINGVIGFFTGLPGDIWSAVSGLWNDMVQLGEKIVGSIVSGIENTASSIGSSILNAIPGGSMVGGAVSDVAGFFKDGGMVPGSGPKLAIVHGGEMVLSNDDLSKLGQAGGSGSGLQIASGGGSAAPAGQGQAQLIVDGRLLGQVIWPHVRTAALQGSGRNAVKVGLG